MWSSKYKKCFEKKNSVKDKEKADMLFDRLESSISRILKYSSVKVESSGIDLLKGMYDDETYRQKMEKAVGEREKALEICKEALKDINRICEVVSVDNFIDDEKLENSKEMEGEVAIIIRELYQNRHI